MYTEAEIIGFEIEQKNIRSYYIYEKDLEHNIVGLYEMNDYCGTRVASYIYDAYGNHKVLDKNKEENKAKDFIGNMNPIRYKGYYYDIETQLFYCNSRYYNPEWGRWISPDSIEYLDPESINGLNLYCYCMNDPINKYDPSGYFAISAFLISVGIGVLFSVGAAYGSDVIDNMKDGFDWSDFNTFEDNWEKYVIAGLKGAITGAAFGVGAGLGISAFKAGVRIAAKTAITAFVSTTVGSFVAGMGIYTLETKGFGLSEYNKSDLWKFGAKMGIKGGLNFGMGLLLGNQGFYDVKNGLLQRTYLKNSLMTPLDMIIEGLLDSMW